MNGSRVCLLRSGRPRRRSPASRRLSRPRSRDGRTPAPSRSPTPPHHGGRGAGAGRVRVRSARARWLVRMDADVSCIKADISEVKVILDALLARVESKLAAWPTAGIASTRSPGLFAAGIPGRRRRSRTRAGFPRAAWPSPGERRPTGGADRPQPKVLILIVGLLLLLIVWPGPTPGNNLAVESLAQARQTGHD